jgi:hypothetical protein
MTAAAKKSRSVEESPPPTNGKGSYTAPYTRKDGTKMVKWGLSVPVEFMQRFKRFAGYLPLDVAANEWVMKTLDEAMEREKAGQR